jgi:hypothetical protein
VNIENAAQRTERRLRIGAFRLIRLHKRCEWRVCRRFPMLLAG